MNTLDFRKFFIKCQRKFVAAKLKHKFDFFQFIFEKAFNLKNLNSNVAMLLGCKYCSTKLFSFFFNNYIL